MSDEQKNVEIPAKYQDLVASIEKLTVVELAELVKLLEEKFGVSAAAPMMMAAASGAAAAEEKSSFNVELAETGGNKIAVIKVIREITGLGLKEAKDLADAAPKVVKESVAKAEAEEMKKKLEDAGGKVNLK